MIVRKVQDLDNAVVEKNYLRASRLAFKLQKPSRLLSIVAAVLSTPDTGDAPAQRSTDMLARLVASFRGAEVAQALSYLRDWNTTARHCHCAQALLHALLARHTPQVRTELFQPVVCLVLTRSVAVVPPAWEAGTQR